MTLTCWWWKSWTITEAIGILPLGIMNVCTTFPGSQTNSCWDIWVWTKVVDRRIDIGVPRVMWLSLLNEAWDLGYHFHPSHTLYLLFSLLFGFVCWFHCIPTHKIKNEAWSIHPCMYLFFYFFINVNQTLPLPLRLTFFYPHVCQHDWQHHLWSGWFEMLATELGELSLYHQRWECDEPFHLH